MEELFLFHKAVLQNLMGLVTEYRKQAGMASTFFKGLLFFFFFFFIKRNS